jgi:site-specific DNA-cytosine methylase
MKILELFAGSRSIGKAAEKLGHEVFSVDWTAYEGIDLVKDISDLQIDDLPWIPDMIWAAPDCTTYSIAAISHHRNGTIPTSDYAKKCDGVNVNVMFLINRLLDHNKDLKWFIENPRGMMRKMPWMIGLPRVTIWYCTYGDDRAKPTDVWSNHIYSLFNTDGWNPKPPCHNDNEHCHHEKAPRGSKTGTQGLSGSYERSMYPERLCIDVINSVNRTI